MTQLEILNYAFMGINTSMEKEQKLLEINPNDKIAQARLAKLWEKFNAIGKLMYIEESKVR